MPNNSYAEFYGEIGVEYQTFFNDPQFSNQGTSTASLVFEPTWTHTSQNGNNIYDAKLFFRYDENDSERSSADIRELSWINTQGDWEFRTGIRKVFWGVAETQHLVDIINQTDSVDRLDGEVKLGQPMLNISRRTNVGDFDLFLLPYFRERTFPGRNGRFRAEPLIDVDNPIFESSNGKTNLDYAARWAHSFGVWDVGLSYFDGNGREPVFRPNENGTLLSPVYPLIRQVGLDAQATVGSWLYKLEAIDRSASERFSEQDFSAVVFGIEKTFFDIKGLGVDVGVLYEFFDNGADSLTDQNVSFVGLRLALNDTQSSDLLIGCDANATICLIEGSRRISDDFKLSLRANTFSGIEEDSNISFLNEDSYVQLNLSYFF